MTLTDGTAIFGFDVNNTNTNAGASLGTVSNHKLGFFTNNSGLEMVLDTSGHLGIGTVNPMSMLQVNGGEVQIGSSGASCTANNAGAIRYSGGTLYYCNASAWTASGAGGGGTVNIGSQYQMAYYSATGTAVSGDSSSTTDASNDLIVGTGKASIGTTTVSQPLTVWGNIDSANAGGYLTEIANAGTTGTTVNALAKLNSSGAAVIAATSDLDGMIGVVVGGAGTTGKAQIAVGGQAACTFDTAPTTAGDFVTISTTTAGNCHDVGSTRSTSSQTIGQVLSTTAISGSNYPVAIAMNAAGGGSGGSGTVWSMIASTDIASAVTSYTFSGLNGDTDGEYQIIARIVGGSGSSAYYLLPNADATTADYGFTYVAGGGGTASAGSGTSNTGLYLGSAAATGHISFSTSSLYAKSGQVRTMIGHWAQDVNGASIADSNAIVSSWTNTASTITSLEVLAGTASGLGVGTHLELWAKRSVGGTAGTGTPNYVARWTSSTALGTGVLYDNGTNVGIGTTNPLDQLHIYSSTGTASAEIQTSLSGGVAQLMLSPIQVRGGATWSINAGNTATGGGLGAQLGIAYGSTYGLVMNQRRQHRHRDDEPDERIRASVWRRSADRFIRRRL